MIHEERKLTYSNSNKEFIKVYGTISIGIEIWHESLRKIRLILTEFKSKMEALTSASAFVIFTPFSYRPTKNSWESIFLFPSKLSIILKALPSPLMVDDPLALSYSLNLFNTIIVRNLDIFCIPQSFWKYFHFYSLTKQEKK